MATPRVAKTICFFSGFFRKPSDSSRPMQYALHICGNRRAST